MMDFLFWLENTRIAILVSQTMYGYPLLETIHAIGMALMIGSLGLLNARVLGFRPQLPVFAVSMLLPVAWVGFALNALTGTALFMSLATEFWFSITFRVKMVLVVLAGVNAWLLGRMYLKPMREAAAGSAGGAAGLAAAGALPGQAPEPEPELFVKAVAASALLFWFGALVAGRLLAYTP
jgi:hypothetical protein